jgi:hypothetical protein
MIMGMDEITPIDNSFKISTIMKLDFKEITPEDDIRLGGYLWKGVKFQVWIDPWSVVWLRRKRWEGHWCHWREVKIVGDTDLLHFMENFIID